MVRDPLCEYLFPKSSRRALLFADQKCIVAGRDDGLFRAAIGESGFGGILSRYPGGANNTEAMDALYNLLVSNTSCASTANTSASLDCLRSLPFDEINNALNGTEAAPWPPMLDGDFSK